MKNQPCSKCQDLLDGTINKRHSDLERTGLAQSCSFHGSNDDEYFYQCRKCGTRFVGDSGSTWPRDDTHHLSSSKLNKERLDNAISEIESIFSGNSPGSSIHLKYKGYEADIKYSDEDQTFIGEVINTRDILVFDGNDLTEAEASFHAVVDGYLAEE